MIRSDEVRKELAGLSGGAAVAAPFGEGIYSAEWTERTYAECLRRAEGLLFEGGRVLIDASFRAAENRRRFLELGTRCGVPSLLLVCHADPGVVRARLERRRGDASDADWSVYLGAAERWEPGYDALRPATHRVATDAAEPTAVTCALAWLRQAGLVD